RVVTLGQLFGHQRWSWLGDVAAPITNEYHGDCEHAAEFFKGAELDRHLDAYLAGARWYLKQFAYLVDRLKTEHDPDGSRLLDSAMALAVSEFSWGNGHYPHHLPVVLAGRAGGVVQGRHLAPEAQPIANLWVSVLNAVGVPRSSVGISTGPLD